MQFCKQYCIYLSIPICIITAYLYTSSCYPQYQATAKVAVRGVAAETAADGLHSRALVQKTLAKLPFEASFYSEDSLKKELYGNTVPVRVRFDAEGINTETWLDFAISGDKLAITNGDTIAYFPLGKPVSEPFGKFTVVVNPKYHGNGQIRVRMNSEGQVLSQFYDRLRVKTEGENVLLVSARAGNAQKAADFVNILLHLYNVENLVPATRPVAAPPRPKSRRDLRLAALRNKASRLSRQIRSLQRKAAGAVAEQKEVTFVPDQNQLKIYKALKHFIAKPVSHYVQLPYVDEIEDPDLNDQVNVYNETQEYRQRLLDNPQLNRSWIDSTNRRLMILQSNILQDVDIYLKNGHTLQNISSKESLLRMLRQKERALAHVNEQITFRQHLQPVAAQNFASKPYLASGRRLLVLQKPQDHIEFIPVPRLLIYLIALAIGFIISFGGPPVYRSIRNSGRRLSGFDSLNGRTHNLVAVKPLD